MGSGLTVKSTCVEDEWRWCGVLGLSCPFFLFYAWGVPYFRRVCSKSSLICPKYAVCVFMGTFPFVHNGLWSLLPSAGVLNAVCGHCHCIYGVHACVQSGGKSCVRVPRVNSCPTSSSECERAQGNDIQMAWLTHMGVSSVQITFAYWRRGMCYESSGVFNVLLCSSDG